jgi:ATPase
MTERYDFEGDGPLYIPDTSVIINGGFKKLLLEEKMTSDSSVTIHAALLAELEHQANLGKKIGLIGLKQLNLIRELCNNNGITFTFRGRKPRHFEIDEIDALIRDFVWKENGILVTSDKVQNLSAQAIGVKTLFIKKSSLREVEKSIQIDQFFDSETMSIHLKQGTQVYVKKGKPGNVKFLRFSDDILTKTQIIEYADEIIHKAQLFPDTFVEIDRTTSTIVQYDDKRIVIARPPFSDGWEITAVRPLKQMSMEEYNLPPQIIQRFEEKAEGILVAGSPGAGKTTFTRALALFYEEKGRILKTIESPRDLDLKVEITQYSKNFGTHTEIHDILLLSRPDYTIFDEIRDTDDFRLYTDLRLAGIGLIGVIHSSTAIDAIQRFIGRLELGVIPSVLDTILYIEAGRIQTVLEVKMTVKVPTGLVESDLARPVIEVRDFSSGDIVYEMYTFGEQTVVIPLSESSRKGRESSHAKILDVKNLLEQYTKQPVTVIPKDQYGHRFEIHSTPKDIPILIGEKGKTIKMLENILNVKLDINKSGSTDYFNEFSILKKQNVQIHKRTITLNFPKRLKNQEIRFFLQKNDKEGLIEFFTGTTSKTGKIKLATKSEIGFIIQDAFEREDRSIFWK